MSSETDLEKLSRILNKDPRLQTIVNPKENLPERLIPALTECGREGFNTGVTDENTRHYTGLADLLILGYDGEEVVGYSGYQFGEINGLKYIYPCGGTLKPKAQGKNNFAEVHTLIANSATVDLIVLRTQNPRVYAALQKVEGVTVYPNPDLSMNDSIRSFAQNFSKEKLGDDIDQKTFVARGTYGESLYDDLQHHDQFSSFFMEELDMNFADGDSVILVGEINRTYRND